MNAVVSLTLLFVFGMSAGQAGAQTSPRPSNIVVFGDSLAVGHGSTIPESRFQNCLQRNFPAYHASTYAAIGATTVDALRWIDGLLKLDPQVVVISLGGNDVLQAFTGPKISPQNTFDNLTTIYRELTSRGIKVVHLGLNPPFFYARRLAEIGVVAKAEGVVFVPDILEGLWGHTEFMYDFIHPNDVGYAKACDKIVPALIPYL